MKIPSFPAAAGRLLGVLLLLITAALQAAVADFAAQSIELPVVDVGGRHYDAVLSRHGTGDEFLVTKVLPLPQAGKPMAVFADNVLDVPLIQVGAADYSLQFQLISNNPLRFRLLQALQTPRRGVAALADGRGGINYESVAVADIAGFDKARSLAAFRDTLYPYLRSNTCIGCHNSAMAGGSGAQAPLHADSDVERAHDYALTRTNFADPANSKFVVRMALDRHNCPRSDCAQAGADMLAAINAWKSRISDMLPTAPRLIDASVRITDAEVEQWIAADKATLAADDRDYILYTSMHELHNEGLSASELNIVRAGLSKALNSVARWAPAVVNPVDVNGKGLLYKFDMRDYWGWNKGVTRLLFGGSDDDLAFGRNKRDYRGDIVTTTVQNERYNYSSTATYDPAFAKVVWERVLHGNVEGAVTVGTIPPYINGFRGTRSRNAAGEYIAPADFQWVETAQLIYTLTRPDVYNAIMMIPMYSDQLETELGVDKSKGMDSYDYVVSYDAITIDSRLLWRAQRKDGGWYWKTWDIFTGQLANGDRNIFEVYRDAGSDIRFPWWANPVPVFVDWRTNRKDTTTWSFVASLAQPFTNSPAQIPAGCDPQPNFSRITGFYNCRHFTGTGGLQQSASEIIWDLPNGLQGYMLTGAFNQRRVDAFVNIVRDPRLIPNARDNIATQTGFAFGKSGGGIGGFNDPRLNVGSSCMGCHIDGMNRINNDLRDWLDESSPKLPAGPYGVDPWIKDAQTVQRVKQLYPPSSEVRPLIEAARKTFLESMADIKHGMMIGADKNLYVEPVIWTVEYVQRKKYRYPQTTSN